jgi:hypothetical protein
MADIRIKDLATTATTTASDDFMAVDGTTNGTRKMNAAAPAFLTSVTTPSLTSPASTNLTLGTTSYGTALTVASATGNVGIGTTGPSKLLTLEQSNTGTSVGDSVVLRINGQGGSVNTRSEIGFHYAGSGTNIPDTIIGSRVVSSSGVDKSAFYIATRDVTTNTAPTERFVVDTTGNVSISSNTAGSVGAGALVVTGGLATGAASYFAGAVTVATGAAVGGATAGAGGLAFPATAVAVADANTLDDYEEGTWTPASSVAMTGTSSPSGKYTKIGRIVYCTGQIGYTGLTGGDVTISGLPFTNGSVRQATVNVFLGAAATSVIPIVVESSDTQFYFTPNASYAGTARTASFSCWYQV